MGDKAKLAVQTSHNRRLSEMAVGVEIGGFLHPLTACGSAGSGAPSPPLRQAAGRYLPFTLLRCEFIDNALKIAAFYRALLY